MNRLCFVSSRRGNYFMTELLQGVASVARDEGLQVDFAFDHFPSGDEGAAYVIVPHEYFTTVPQQWWPDTHQLRRTISFCVEMPGTQWFELTAAYGAVTGSAVSINSSAARELGRRGVPAPFFQLGYSPFWDHWQRNPGLHRPTDVVYMGSTDPRRDALLAGYGEVLWRYETRLLIPSTSPRTERRPEYLIGAEKYGLLAASKILINLHRGDSRSLEWARVLEAVINGCVVVSEHSLDSHPLRSGQHFVSCAPESIAAVVDQLLQDPELLSQIRTQGYDFVRQELSMAPAIGILAELGADLVKKQASTGALTPSVPAPDATTSAPVKPAAPPDRFGSELAKLQSGLVRLSTEINQVRAAMQFLISAPGNANGNLKGEEMDDGLRTVWSTPAYAGSARRVSVLVPVCNHEHYVQEALASVVASSYEDIEVLLCDDASFDRSAEAVLEFLRKHPWLPATLLVSPINQGPSRIRNRLAVRSSGEFLFLLDSDNRIYPPTIERLVKLLDTESSASFAYAILGAHLRGEPTRLISRVSWDPELLIAGPYIDTMSLIRRAAFISIGGFCEDPRLTQWEDYDLWCRFASHGHSGAFLPQILGWYRQADHSRNASWELGLPDAVAFIRERSPELFLAGVGKPGTSRQEKTLCLSPA